MQIFDNFVILFPYDFNEPINIHFQDNYQTIKTISVHARLSHLARRYLNSKCSCCYMEGMIYAYCKCQVTRILIRIVH